jgi:hypothetical protein
MIINQNSYSVIEKIVKKLTYLKLIIQGSLLVAYKSLSLSSMIIIFLPSSLKV